MTFFRTALLMSGLSLAGGTWVDTVFVPPSLGFPNQVRIYLPEGYDPLGATEYPVIYWLHGWSVGGTPGHTAYEYLTKLALDSLISSEQIAPVMVVKPNGSCPPYGGSMWANSILYGDYEGYVVYDLVEFMEENYRVSTEAWERCIAGHSMGAGGSMDIALRHPDRYGAVASHAGPMDYSMVTEYLIPVVLSECPESEPPYSYDWGNGFYTNFLFMTGGAFSPNLSVPDSVDFLLNENGEVVDSVYARYNQHNPSQMVKLLSPQPDLGIFLDCGDKDDIVGVYVSNCTFSDTLTSLGIAHVFQSLPGVGHGMNLDRFIQELLFLDQQMTGIEGGPVLGASILHLPTPNPFSGSTGIRFELPAAGPTRIDVYDLSGRLVRTLLNGMMSGEHSVDFSGSELASGVYLVRLASGSESAAAKVILVR